MLAEWAIIVGAITSVGQIMGMRYPIILSYHSMEDYPTGMGWHNGRFIVVRDILAIYIFHCV